MMLRVQIEVGHHFEVMVRGRAEPVMVEILSLMENGYPIEVRVVDEACPCGEPRRRTYSLGQFALLIESDDAADLEDA